VPAARTLSWDWYPGVLPDNVEVDDTAYVETTVSLLRDRSEQMPGVRYGRGASTYLGTMFDVGPHGRVTLGEYALVHGARIICDAEISIGAYALVSWNVVLMDTYRVHLDPAARREDVRRVPERRPRGLGSGLPAHPVHIGRNSWIGFDACILPGVTVGEGSIVGARSVVTADVEPFTIVAGNPARFVRRLTGREVQGG
jgi:acetyltransferase-like isoleucine patch superfamily enzyme